MDTITQYISAYLPVVFMVITFLLNHIEVFKALKQNVNDIAENKTLKAIREELAQTRDELASMKSQCRAIVERQGALINELSKVQQYEVGNNKEIQ